MAGRFAPSPTGDLHLGNLRTGLVAWLVARSSGRLFLLRIEDLDRVRSSVAHERRQLDDLAALGLDHDGEVVRQSERFDRYDEALDRLRAAGMVYECFCTRREIAAEIAAAASAPHDGPVGTPRDGDTAGGGTGDGLVRPDGAYPGTCRTLTRARLDEQRAAGRPPAWRLRADAYAVTVVDALAGTFTGVVDDVVLRRNDGVPAYNLAVVVDDAAQGVTQVVRGDDLLSSTPRQVHLQRLLGHPPPDYLHVPLVLGEDGTRLAKRHGAVALTDLAAQGVTPVDVVRALARSLGLADADTATSAADLLVALDGRPLDPASIPRAPVVVTALTGLQPSSP